MCYQTGKSWEDHLGGARKAKEVFACYNHKGHIGKLVPLPMNIPIKVDCQELHRVETRTPQLDVDLCALEHEKARVGPENFARVIACFWAGLISWTLKNARN